MSVRKYSPIWLALKKAHKVAISVPRPYHKRVIKAVVKEKYGDLEYKFELGERGKKAKISYTVRGAIITFNLNHTLGVEDL